MTEDEAKQKWCPFAKSRLVTLPVDDGKALHEYFKSFYNQDRPGVMCIGSECMAWRATDNEFEPEPPETSAVRVAQQGKPAGYCGLAGKP